MKENKKLKDQGGGYLSMPKLKTIGIQLGLFAASALMLTFIQVPHKGHFLAWVALVPFVVACRGESKSFALIAIMHNPTGLWRRLYAALCGASAYVGALVAARHVWLQHLPEDQVPACGPPLDYLLENFPLQDAINTLLMGDGNCAEVAWTFLGLSIPEQTLIVFCVALAISAWQALRSESAAGT